MSILSEDTPRNVRKMLIQGYRNMSPQMKLKRVSEATLAVQQLALARIRKQHGSISNRERWLRLASLWLDKKTMKRVFDWDVDIHGY